MLDNITEAFTWGIRVFILSNDMRNLDDPDIESTQIQSAIDFPFSLRSALFLYHRPRRVKDHFHV